MFLREARENRRKLDGDYLKQRRKNREQYIRLYKNKKTLKAQPEQEKKELEHLEDDLEFDDILLYRRIALAALRKEKQNEQKKTAMY